LRRRIREQSYNVVCWNVVSAIHLWTLPNRNYLELADDGSAWLESLATSWLMVYPTPLTPHFALFYQIEPGTNQSLGAPFRGDMQKSVRRVTQNRILSQAERTLERSSGSTNLPCGESQWGKEHVGKTVMI
jgi:hypothetical protein